MLHYIILAACDYLTHQHYGTTCAPQGSFRRLMDAAMTHAIRGTLLRKRNMCYPASSALPPALIATATR
ncbi:MAG: hypothetical protein JO316_22670 [Abitibacteriaceae bacterium]|nr:hypothetical protein [Abditibacteriaceae bacterium]MBV9868168.1 hypothetical protein [Abditibacteriaceae bacterium]